MKSIKPGRGPSMLGAIIAIAIAIFGILWVIMASDITSTFSDSPIGGEFIMEDGSNLGINSFIMEDGSSLGIASPLSSVGSIFPLFGLIFVAVAVVLAVYHFKNATGKNRYSTIDIVDGDEEPDPLNKRYGADTQHNDSHASSDSPSFCPYCGNDLKDDHVYCNRCGKKVK